MPDLLSLLLALLGGLVGGVFIGRRAALARAAVDQALAEQEALRAADERQRLGADLAQLQAERARLSQERDEARSAAAAAEARREEQERAHRAAEARTLAAFRELAGTALRENSEQFLSLAKTRFDSSEKQGAAELEQRRQAIEALVKPLAEKLTEVARTAQELDVKREKAYSDIQAQFNQFAQTTSALQKSSHALTEALRGSSQARGRWGELALRNIAELAGMTEHCDFEVQVTDAEGQRPDMVVKLPGGGAIPVDAKAPFADYQRACETSDPAERERCLAAHANALRSHVRTLARRDYSRTLDAVVDYTVMFVPADAVLSAAFETNPDLQVEALRERVLIATPVTLVALLRTVGIYWSQEKLARNAREAVEVAREFHERVSTFAEHLGGVGRGLEGAVKAYNKAIGSFESRVLPQGRRLAELGAIENAARQLESPGGVESTLRAASSAPPLLAESADTTGAASGAAASGAAATGAAATSGGPAAASGRAGA